MDPKKMKPAGVNKDAPYPEMELDIPTALEDLDIRLILASAPEEDKEKLQEKLMEEKMRKEQLMEMLKEKLKEREEKEKMEKIEKEEEEENEEIIEYEFGLEALFNPKRLHPRVEALIYWRDIEKSGMVFVPGLIALMAFAQFSTLGLLSSFLLAALLGSFALRVYASVMQVINAPEQRGDQQIQEYLELDLTVSQERVQNLTGVAVDRINYFIAQMKRLFLFEDLFESFNFGITLGFLSIIGRLFNGMTLVILAFVFVFTLPKIYETNKEAIDAQLDLIRVKLTQVIEQIRGIAPNDSNVVAIPEDDE